VIFSIITLIITFLLILLPYFVYNAFADILNKKQKASFYIKKYINISLFFTFFFLLLFSSF